MFDGADLKSRIPAMGKPGASPERAISRGRLATTEAVARLAPT